MAKKIKTEKKTANPKRLDRTARQARLTRIIFIVVSVIIILTWILTLIVKI